MLYSNSASIYLQLYSCTCRVVFNDFSTAAIGRPVHCESNWPSLGEWSSLFMESLISIPTKGPIDRKGRVRTLETLLSLAAIATQSETKKRSNSYATYGVRLYAR